MLFIDLFLYLYSNFIIDINSYVIYALYFYFIYGFILYSIFCFLPEKESAKIANL